MLLRWWHEGVRYKPFRPVTERLLLTWCALLGLVGSVVKRGWHLVRRIPPAPPLDQVSVRRLVCIRPDRIGDMMLLTPALMALRERFPQAHITLLTSTKTVALMSNHPAVDEIVTVPGDRLQDFWNGRQVLRQLRQQSFDVIIVFESIWNCAFLAWSLGGTVRLGYDDQGSGFLLTHPLSYPYRRVKAHQVLVNARLVMALGCSEATATGPLSMPVSDASRQAAQRWLAERGLADGASLVMMHPGSRARHTQWDPERFGVVAEWLHQHAAVHLLVLYGPGEDRAVERMRRAMSFDPCLVKGLPLDHVAALMSRCKIFLGNSTGTTHLAAAVGPVAVMIIGGTHPLDCPEHWGPWGKGHVIVHKPPLEAIGRETLHWVGPEGLKHIQPNDVIRALRRLLSRELAAAASAGG